MLLAAITVAFVLTVSVMFVVFPFAKRIGLIDAPGGRKKHDGSVPVIGGLAMLFGTAIGLYLIAPPMGGFVSALLAGSLLVVIGAIDDRSTLATSFRFITQISVILIMIFGANLQIKNIGDPFGIGLITMGDYGVIFTVIAALTTINAYNLIDGMDGLAGLMVLIALLAIASVAGIQHLFGAAALIAASSIVGFLLFNFPVKKQRRMRSFMGDAGSTLLGLTVVWVTLGASQGAYPVISPVHCLWFIAVPIFDCLACFIKRVRKHRSPFMPARDHAHHILLRGRFSVRGTVAILVGTQLFYAIVGVTGHFTGVPDVVMFVAWSIAGLSHRIIIGKIAKSSRLRKINEAKRRSLARKIKTVGT